MITEIEIENYKSIEKVQLQLGRINVFIGENGAGKSNILEVIALAGAAAADKLDNEFLSSRGIRVTRPEYMRPAFSTDSLKSPISVGIKYFDEKIASIKLNNENSDYSKWTSSFEGLSEDGKDVLIFSNTIKSIKKKIDEERTPHPNFPASLDKIIKDAEEIYMDMEELRKKYINANGEEKEKFENLERRVFNAWAKPILALSPASEYLGNFIIYSPENSSLRKFTKEGQIEPLGVNGEGLLKLISHHSKRSTNKTIAAIKSSMEVLGWFKDFKISKSALQDSIEITDRFIDESIKNFNSDSANEGFFFLLFYFALFNSPLTPNFFAIDNIDASLNPKLCQKLIEELSAVAKKTQKQAILTTHNPAILDGLNLHDNDQRLFVVSRDRRGRTKVLRIKPDAKNNSTAKLSELFLRGIIGGLPKGF